MNGVFQILKVRNVLYFVGAFMESSIMEIETVFFRRER